MNKKDFKKGQKVYLKIIKGSDAARYIDKSDRDAWIKEKIVTKISSKYITVANDFENKYGEEKFDISNDFRHCYTVGGQDYELYLSLEALKDDMESEELYSCIRGKFSDRKNNRKYSTEQLRKIREIIK